jgi:methionine-rich copper-binding protein CopC
MQRRWTGVIVLVATGVGLLGGHLAHAHAFLDHAEPRVGSTVHAAPVAVVLTFTEPVEAGFCRVDVRTEHDAPVTASALDHPKPEELRLPLPPLPPGVYTVHWTVTSVDTHQTEGRFEFTVASP